MMIPVAPSWSTLAPDEFADGVRERIGEGPTFLTLEPSTSLMRP